MSQKSVGGAPDEFRVASRRRVLAVLRASPEGCRVAEVADRTDLHPSTVRFHLDRLERDGLISRKIDHSGEPGRPPLAYTADPVPDAGHGHREYRQLAEVLAQSLAGSDADQETVVDRSVEAGRLWGLARSAGHAASPDPADALEVLETSLRDIGFVPETDVTDRNVTVVQRHCPFLEVAQNHQDVVCSVHLGLIRGTLEAVGASVTADRLVPFASPAGCHVHLTVGD